MRLRLLPENPQFFALFNAAADNVATAGRLLYELLDSFPDTTAAHAALRGCEREGDRITHELVRLLGSTFVTPLDREDLFSLATALDDIVDHVDEAADELVLYGVREVPSPALEQARVTREACAVLARAVRGLRGLGDIRELLVQIHTLENEADGIQRAALGRLFSGGEDPLVIIRWKDIHEQIESAANACERAAGILESIYLKHR